MSTEKRDFDKEAGAWDENPVRVKLVKDVAQAISKQIALRPDMAVLDFGCGTGLLSLQIQPLVRSVTGVDSSPGMLAQFNRKIEELRLRQVETVLVDLDQGHTLPGQYDLVISNMTLHHIQRIEPLLAQFHSALRPGGYLCLSDLDPDEGRFHGDNTGVFHFGFERTALRKVFTAAGFADVVVTDAAEVVKPGADGKMNRFGVFLMTGRRP